MSPAKEESTSTEPESKAELDQAFEELYRNHLRDVYSYAYYRVGNHHDAEDLTEQAFLQAYRHFDRVEPPAHPHETERVVEGREELRAVISRLDELSDDRREALIMRFALGMSNREIARALGRSDGATKVLIHRAIKQLEELMADD